MPVADELSEGLVLRLTDDEALVVELDEGAQFVRYELDRDRGTVTRWVVRDGLWTWDSQRPLDLDGLDELVVAWERHQAVLEARAEIVERLQEMWRSWGVNR